MQIDIKLTDAGLDKEFIAGLVGNVKNEGKFGLFEGVNKNGKASDGFIDKEIQVIGGGVTVMKKICILLAFITAFILAFFVAFPKNLGERTPIWEVKERFFGDEYGRLRSEYFISFRIQMWYDQSSILYRWSDHDIFRITEVYLKVREEIADKCKIKTSGVIEWKQYGMIRCIYADALTDTPLRVSMGSGDYTLDDTEDSIEEFETATGINASELLDTVSVIRNEYREALNKISVLEYQKLWTRIEKVIMRVIVMWVIYILIWAAVRITQKVYQKKIDESMKDFL